MISGFTGSAVQVIGLSSIYLTAVGLVQFLYGWSSIKLSIGIRFNSWVLVLSQNNTLSPKLTVWFKKIS